MGLCLCQISMCFFLKLAACNQPLYMSRPSKIHLHKRSKTLELTFEGKTYHLSAEFLRVHSPSAEVKGHGPNQAILVDGKIDVGIDNIKMAGNYGLILVFDDGHDSGIYTWLYLKELTQNQQEMWQIYLDKLEKAQKKRDPHTQVIYFSS